MQDILLLAAVAAVFVFGYFCVKKLDLFFDDSEDRNDLNAKQPAADSSPNVSELSEKRQSNICIVFDTLKTISILLASTLIGFGFDLLGFTEANNIAVYIFGVLVISVITSSRLYGILASVVSVLIFNFFFTTPRFTFRFDNPDYFITFTIMFMVTLLSGSLATRLKENAKQSIKNAREKEKAAIMAQNEQLRANMLRSISHDLRTPLTSICGSAGNLLANYEKMDDTMRKQTFTDIYDDSMWLINLGENILAVTKMEGGQVNLTLSMELMDEVITESMKHVNRKRKEHTIKVTSSNDFILAHIDVNLIVQVIVNLVDNAIKYTPEGSTIEIHTEQKEKWVIVSVKDNGPGIPDSQKTHVFDMFYSGANRVADSKRSLGLGLSLCKSIVTAHGGTIQVTDNEPSGSVFTFTLPAGEVNLNE